MNEKIKTNVFIGGKVYTIVGTEPQEYMQKVAALIDKKLMEIRKNESSLHLSTAQQAILTSINVADEYFKALKLCEDLEKEVNRLRQENDKSHMEIVKLRNENTSISEQLILARKELNDYILTFDRDKKVK